MNLMINYAGVGDREDGRFYNIFKRKISVEMCGYGRDEIWAVVFREDPKGTYWAWQDTDEDEFSLIQPDELLFNVQFPDGPKSEAAAGRGRIVKLAVEKFVTPSELIAIEEKHRVGNKDA